MHISNMASPLVHENVWFDKYKYEEAEKRYFEKLAKGSPNYSSPLKSSLADEVARARQHIKSSLECVDGIAAIAATGANSELVNRVSALEKENATIRKSLEDVRKLVKNLESKIYDMQKLQKLSAAGDATQNAKPTPPTPKITVNADDDDVDLFGSESEEEDDESKRVREQRLAEYAKKKSKKPVLIAKSNIILDVKPWDDETDMAQMEKEVRKITTDGLVWGASKLVPLAYGIKKLQISCVVEDDLVSVDWLQETIQELEDFVQSVDIAAFNKV